MWTLTEPDIVDILSSPVKSLLRPKSIILTQLGSPLFYNIKFSGLISLHILIYSRALELRILLFTGILMTQS